MSKIAAVRLKVNAGQHDRQHTPISVDIGDISAGWKLVRVDSGAKLPCQVLDGVLHCVIDEMAAGSECELQFEPSTEAVASVGVQFDERKTANALDVTIGGAAFTTYHYSDHQYRPYFHPLLGPGGVQITRNFPMIDNLESETNDHVHHRSVWVAHGNVNGSDNWAEQETSGFQAHQRFTLVEDGPAVGMVRQQLQWQDEKRKHVLSEARAISFFNTPDNARIMDLGVTFTADQGNIVFGSTKEGGICSVRVATSMDGNKGGRISNSAGGIGEDETWGKPAHWCDYSGPCQGRQVGIAIFDHPMNLRHPTPWHVRNYGLMTANPFGHADFKSSHLTDGSYTLESGQTLAFNYRLFLHDGDANLRDRYHDWVHPPTIKIID